MTIPPTPVPPAPDVVGPASAAPTASSPRPTWWRRNLLALVAVAVLLPATAAVIGWQGWRQFFAFDARPVTPVLVAPDDTVDLVGATWGPIRGGELDDLAGLDVPPGATVIAVAVPVDAPDGVACDAPVLTEQATGRSWTPVRGEIGLDYSPDEPASCLASDTGSYELIVPFVVPDDVEGPFWVDVRPSGSAGAFVRFPLEP
ncbi:hypothetical protein [Microbacterium maritypicum]